MLSDAGRLIERTRTGGRDGYRAAGRMSLARGRWYRLAITLHNIPEGLAVGVAYVAGEWRGSPRRMDFLRFTGELFIYYVLIALGGNVGDARATVRTSDPEFRAQKLR